MAIRGPIFGYRFVPLAMIVLWIGMISSTVLGQQPVNIIAGNYPQGSVGGISINPDGLLANATVDAVDQQRKAMQERMEDVPGDLNQAVPQRMVSLRRLEAAIVDCAKNNKPLPDSVRFLAGLQHIQYVFVYPEQQDIVLVGPAEGWKINAKGAVVGVTTNRPVMLLDDLLVALRTAQAASQGGISCSIDPAPEGVVRLQQYFDQQKSIDQVNVEAMENAMGPQNIRISGVPAASHFARVLVAADYRMKRLSMAFDPSPVRGLPSYLEMLTPAARAGKTPRFWLEPQFEAVLRDPSGLAWELRGASVKAMTEEDFWSSTGNVTHSGKANPTAQKWANLMTKKYAELAAADAIFGQAQNCMELAVVGALVAKERLTEKAGYNLPVLFDAAHVQTEEANVPKQVASMANMLKKGNHQWVVSVSGGVAINSWALADMAKPSDAVAPVRVKSAPASGGSWWWN